MTVNFAIGTSDFAEIINFKNTYLDKTLLIKELIEDASKVILFPRPRRFGKTLNMMMLKYFLDLKTIEKNKHLFNKLKISQHPNIMAHQGKYPVIYISLKEIKKDNYPSAINAIGLLIQALFSSYRDLREYIESNYSEYLDFFDRLLRGIASEEELAQSLKFLSQILEKKYEQKVWILIDEYDTPIHAAWEFDFYQPMKTFMQGFLGSALKDNNAVYKSILTGIFRVSKEGMFSDLNNITVHSMMNRRYGEYFGFTEEEVDWICEEAHLKNLRQEIRTWYNGYQFGELNIYNPWSIINFATEKKFLPYWVKTGSSDIIESLIRKTSEDFKSDLEVLIQGGVITQIINEKISLPEINYNAEESLWNFLLFSGYLKINQLNIINGDCVCELKIPNSEILTVYEKYFLDWLKKSNPRQSEKMLAALVSGDIETFEEFFTYYLQDTLSYFDVSGREPERFYHALVLGMLVALKNTHQILSNRESGLGRYDLMIIPKDISKLGLIIEFKSVKKEELLEPGAEAVLVQINQKNYQAELESRGIKNILKLAIVSFGKKVLIKI